MKQNEHITRQHGVTAPLVPILICAAILLLAAAMSLVRFLGSEGRGDDSTTELKAAPDFALRNLVNDDVKLSAFRGKVVVVNFWATWCGPCVMEVPSLVRLRKGYGDQGLEIIGISLDSDDDIDAVRKFVKDYRINYPVVIGTEEVLEAYGPIEAIPVTFVVDREGRIRRRHLGMLTYKEIEEAIKPLL